MNIEGISIRNNYCYFFGILLVKNYIQNSEWVKFYQHFNTPMINFFNLKFKNRRCKMNMTTYGIGIRTVIRSFFLGALIVWLFWIGFLKIPAFSKIVQVIDNETRNEKMIKENPRNREDSKNSAVTDVTDNDIKNPYRFDDTKTDDITNHSSQVSRNYIIYLVSTSDTLEDICQLYGVSPQRVIELNNLSDPKNLVPGTQLLIPSS